MPYDVVVALLSVPRSPRSTVASREDDSLGLGLTSTLSEVLMRQFSTGDVLGWSKEEREEEEYDGETRRKILIGGFRGTETVTRAGLWKVILC